MTAVVFASAGCLVTVKHRTDVTGTPISESTLSQIIVGETTEEWLVAVLGAPSSSSIVSGGVAGSDAASDDDEPAEVGNETAAEPVDVGPTVVDAPQVKIMRWDYSRRKSQRGTIFLLLKTNSESSTSTSIRAEIRDGIVMKYWVEKT